MTLDRTFYILIFKQEAVAAPVSAIFFSLFYSWGLLLEKILIVLGINFIIITRINDGNAVINNHGRIHLILLSNISMGT